jgi:RNA polymerase primary sigma factor
VNQEELILSELPRVRLVAFRYSDYGMDVDDLVSEGAIGLVHAASRFEPERNVDFWTYAWGYVRGRMLRALNTQRDTVRVPIHRKYQIQTISLQAPIGDPANDFTIADFIPAENTPIPGHDLQRREHFEELRELLDNPLIPGRERDILKAWFGIGVPQESLERIALRLNLTQERVRQLYQRGLERLRRKLKANL